MTRPARAGEAVAVSLAGAALGAAAASPFGWPVVIPIGTVAALNGAVSGWRGIYDWRSGKGPLALVLDSTWASVTTLAGLGAHCVAALQRRPGYAPQLSERQNRHVYARGLQIRKGFAVTLGNVVNGAGDLTRARRAKLVTDHEDVHVWQSRWFGPAYPVLYGGWMVCGALAGPAVWARRHRHQRLSKVIETCAYYANPFEWWAYSRDDHWPPSGKLPTVGWRKPVVRSFAQLKGLKPPDAEA